MRIERDIAVATRDGTPIAVDVFRPDGDEPVPVIAGISPYGKDLHWPERFPLYDLVEQGEHMVWETPNPDWWVPRGYALVRADTRGTGKSPGVLDLFGPKDAEDFYDVIEWSAAQPWSTGKVAASGISWYAMMAWRVAALQPPHLAAVIAWEGLTDFYREAARRVACTRAASSSCGGCRSSRSATAPPVRTGARSCRSTRCSTPTTRRAPPI